MQGTYLVLTLALPLNMPEAASDILGFVKWEWGSLHTLQSEKAISRAEITFTRVPGASTRSPAHGKGHEVKGPDRQRRVGP